jgi:hypothetical protein
LGGVIRQVAADHLNQRTNVGRSVVADLVLSSGELGLLEMAPPSPSGRAAYRKALEPLAEEVRAWVVEARGDRTLGLSFVGRVAPTEHRSWLVEHLDYPRATVRAEAVQAVAQLGESDELLRRLTQKLDDESVLVRTAASASWRQYEPSLLRSALEAPVERMARRLEDEATSVQFEAARTLGHLGGDDAMVALADQVDQLRRPARSEALRVLRTSDHPRARQVLERYRGHWDVEVRRTVK